MEEIVLVKKNNKNKKKIIGITLSLALVLMVIGVSYAFFGYYKTGLYTHTINGGKMSVIYDEITGNNIKIDNAYPLSDEEALSEAIEFEFSITGYNESKKNVYYKIEMDYGSEIENKTRFKDSDMKLTLYENEELVLENEIFENLDNQGIYFGYIKSGTSVDTPIINNYKLRLWINDNVYVSNSIEDDTTLWDDDDFNWAYNNLDYDQIREFEEGNATKLSEVGVSVYKTADYGNLYGSFRINVHANLSGDDIGILVYDNNGGVGGPTQSFLTTNMVTMQKPTMEGKGFLGWSSKKDATVPEYYAGDYYAGPAMTLYAVYGGTKNVMGVFPEDLLNYSSSITDVKFVGGIQNNIDNKYNNAELKWDLTLDNQGSVKAWLDETTLYIASSGTTYLTNCASMFEYWENLIDVNFSNADTSMVTDMSGMFSSTNLESLDLSGFDTSNVTNMSGMFANCNEIASLDLSSFNTSKVIDMSRMFYVCASLLELDVTSFDTRQVTDMSSMFGGEIWDEGWTGWGNRLRELDLSSFDTSNVTDMSYMFNGCANVLEKIDISNFDTSNVKIMAGMFADFSDISIVDFSKFDTSKVENMSRMFLFNSFPENFDFDFLEINSVTDMSSMFGYCGGYLNFNNKDLSNVSDMSYMFTATHFRKLNFENCILNPGAELSGFLGNQYEPSSNIEVSFSGTQNIHTISFNAYTRREYLKKVDLSYTTFVNKTSMYHFLYGNEVLEIADFTGCDLTGVTNLNEMFYMCQGLKEVIFKDVIMPDVVNMSDMFGYCKSIEKVDMSGVETNNVTNMSYLFKFSTLKYLDISSFTFDNVTSYYSIFANTGSSLTDSYTEILVKSETEQNWILNLPTTYRPADWSTSNVIVKTS